MDAPSNKFDNEAHEARIAARYEELAHQQAKFDAFDYLVDLALDGQITVGEAIRQFKTELTCGVDLGKAAS